MDAQLLYDWERNYVEPKAQSFLSREGCLSLVRRAAIASNIRMPTVRFAKSASMSCRAIPSRWELVIADWGRTPVTVLHEVAHLASLRAVMAGEDPHGPTFLAQAIRFYATFIGFDEAWLRKTARTVGLAVGPETAKPPRRTVGGFDDVEF